MENFTKKNIDSEVNDTYLTHAIHDVYEEGCSECFKENQIIRGSHEDMLNKHPALKNNYGSNYPTGYVPE